MKRGFALLTLALGLVGCKDFNGQFTVVEPIQLKEYKLFGKEKRAFTVGDYSAKLVVTGEDSFKLNVIRKGKSRNFKFKVPKESLPTYFGEFHIPASKVDKQNYGIKGIVTSKTSSSDTYNTTESCYESFTIEDCYCSVDSAGDPVKKCETKYKTVSGEKEVEYYYSNTETDLNAELIDKRGKVVAQFTGGHSDSDKVYTYEDRCQLNRRPPRDRGRYISCHQGKGRDKKHHRSDRI